MKNRKGFTLIELMAVVAILAILALIITPIVDNNIKKSKNQMYLMQIENIRIAGENYYLDNIALKPTNNNYSFVTLETLTSLKYIGDVKNPKTGNAFEEEIYIQLLNDNGTYVYSVCPIEDNCEDYS